MGINGSTAGLGIVQCVGLNGSTAGTGRWRYAGTVEDDAGEMAEVHFDRNLEHWSLDQTAGAPTSSSSLSDGEIAGIVVGSVLVGVVAVALLVRHAYSRGVKYGSLNTQVEHQVVFQAKNVV